MAQRVKRPACEVRAAAERVWRAFIVRDKTARRAARGVKCMHVRAQHARKERRRRMACAWQTANAKVRVAWCARVRACAKSVQRFGVKHAARNAQNEDARRQRRKRVRKKRMRAKKMRNRPRCARRGGRGSRSKKEYDYRLYVMRHCRPRPC